MPSSVIKATRGEEPVSRETKQQLVALVPRLRRFAYGLTGSMDEGDDLVQAACERALGRLHQWQKGTRLDSWMFRIVQTIWIDRMRAQKTRGRTSDLEQAAHVVGDDGVRTVESRLTLDRVRTAIAELPEEQRLVLAMISIDGRSYKETAEALDLPIGTVTSRLARARHRLYAAAQGSSPAEPAGGKARETERG